MTTARSLAFVCPRYAEGGTVGGAETLLKNLAERAAGTGWNVTFLTTCARDHFTWKNELPPGARRAGNMDVQFFPVNESRDTRLFLRIQGAISAGAAVSRKDQETWIENSVNSPALYQYLREHGDRFDRIVMGPYLFGLVYFAAQVLPQKTLLVPCLHDEPFARLDIMKDLFERVRGFMFNTEPEKLLAQSLFPIPDSRCAIVGMGLDAFEADPQAFSRRRGLNRPYVIYSGRREGGKGTPLLAAYMHAFRERTGQDVKLVFTGSGPIEAPPEMNPHILDVGFVSEQEKHDAMAGAKAFVHPSTFESLGIVLLESFLAGTPALVHAGSQVLQWQCRRSQGGLWFRNYAEFEEELLLLLRDENLRLAMGRSGRQYVLEEYSWKAVESRFAQAMNNI